MGVTSGIEWIGDHEELMIFLLYHKFLRISADGNGFLPQNKTPLLREARRAFFAPLNVGLSFSLEKRFARLREAEKGSLRYGRRAVQCFSLLERFFLLLFVIFICNLATFKG
jgi:hypothetical protein